MAYQEYSVTLKIIINDDNTHPPENWKWHETLNMLDDETVEVTEIVDLGETERPVDQAPDESEGPQSVSCHERSGDWGD